MASIDFIILALAAVSFVIGYRKGLLGQLGAIVAVAGGIIGSRLFTGPVLKWLNQHGYLLTADTSQWTPYQYMPRILVSILLFIVIFILVKLLFNYTRLFFETLKLGIVNRLCGALFAMFVAFFCLSLFLNFCQFFKKDGWIIDGSTLGGGRPAQLVMNLAPAAMGTAVDFMQRSQQNNEKPEL